MPGFGAKAYRGKVHNEIQQIRMVFKYAYDASLVDQPIRYGPTFKRPSKRVLRLHRNGNGPKMFEPDEIHKLLTAAPIQLRAMTLLGVNCGFGNSDCGSLPLTALNLKGGWVDFPRPKTGIQRRCPLWAESVQAIQSVLAERKEPRKEEDKDIVIRHETPGTVGQGHGESHKCGIPQAGKNFGALSKGAKLLCFTAHV